MRRILVPFLAVAAVDGLPAFAFVALMAGQSARPLNGVFNNVPVLHSNQPEEVEGPGILISTVPGVAYAAETGQPLANAAFTFNGDFGVHLHHKYFPPYRGRIRAGQRRTELTIALILINPGTKPVAIRFESGAVRNSFEAPYLGNAKIGVRPLGPRPWNTGPGDATAVQLLRGQLDRRLQNEVVIPPRNRVVLFSTEIPALGIANALLKGRSSGPFQMAVVAASNPGSDGDLLAVLDQGRLAPGRVYLSRIEDINSRRVFSRVGGVALGDAYQAALTHDLSSQGPLHVPLTSTNRHHFGTREVQVNPLASRMVDSSLDNVGTYGLRFDVDLDLRGSGPHQLVLSHPTPIGGKPFIAFRGSLQVRTVDGLQEMHVGMRSGQSVALTTLNLQGGVSNPVRVSLVYPADATPGHLLSVVPDSQLARLRDQERQLEVARAAAAARRPTPSPQSLPPIELPDAQQEALLPPPPPPPPLSWQGAPALMPPVRADQSLVERYQQALEAQQQRLRGLMGN
ncbi:MAG: DUF3370 family protein [Cyanobacteriota bacterium]|nr:DUF3370 family protein [Cyanobacteriota bacterium]